MTSVDVVVDEPSCLQKCIADCCAEEFESSAFHIPAYCIRNGEETGMESMLGMSLTILFLSGKNPMM